MKLNLGNNIRRLRREREITQEQFAEYLGVSPQAISRWENGTTYPDMELIPVIASYLDVTTDILFDISQTQKEAEAEKVMTELARLTHEKDLNTERINELIRDIRQNYLGCDAFWHFWWSANIHAYRNPEILPQVRLTFDAIMSGNGQIGVKLGAIERFSSIESEENIDSFMDEHAVATDITKETLLYRRYLNLGNREKSDLYRQQFLFKYVDEIIGSSSLWHEKQEPYTPEKQRAATELGIQLLNSLCMCSPDGTHPISGGDSVDMWVEPRLWMGVHEVAHLARAGETEKAFVCLEDTVSLLEKAMAITQPVTLSSNSPWLEDISYVAEEDFSPNGESLLTAKQLERMIYIHNAGSCYCIFPSWYYKILTIPEDTRWYSRNCHDYDSIRQDPRYTALTERIRALIETREKE